MSLCLLVQTPDVIIMSGDSRESIEIDGVKYATGHHMRKIQQIGSQVIFTTGSSHVANRIIEEYKYSRDRTIENLHVIMNKHVNRFIEDGGMEYIKELKHVVGVVVGSFRDGKTVFHSMSSDKPGIAEFVGDRLRASDGYRCTEALSLLNQCNHADIRESYRHVYNSLSCEDIGGQLTIYAIDKNGIKEVTYPIIDSREIKTLPSEKAMYTREQGIVIQREDQKSRAIFNADELRLQVGNGTGSYTDALWFDAPGGIFKFAGHIEAESGLIGGWTIEPDKLSGSGKIEGGAITGALIQTKTPGSYPRASLSTAAETFELESSPGKLLQIITDSDSPVLRLLDGSGIVRMTQVSGSLSLFCSQDINITTDAMNFKRVYINSVDVLSAINSKANAFSGYSGSKTVGSETWTFNNGVLVSIA